jgi:hypothetical protein
VPDLVDTKTYYLAQAVIENKSVETVDWDVVAITQEGMREGYLASGSYRSSSA